MYRAVAAFAIAIALLAAAVPQGGMRFMHSVSMGHGAAHCMEGSCPTPDTTPASDCADRCLAAGPVRAETGTFAALAACAGLVLYAALGGLRRVPRAPTTRLFTETIGKTLALERVATDVLRN